MAADHGGPHPDPDLYRLLGVPREASRQDIAQAWRRRARTEHPDARPRDAAAPARFRALAEAYQVLGNPARRAAYDRALGHEAGPGAGEPAVGSMSPGPGPAGSASPGGVPAGPTSARPASAGPVSRPAGVGVPIAVTVVRVPEPPLRAEPPPSAEPPLRAGPVWTEIPHPTRTADVRAADEEARLAVLAELALRYLAGHRGRGRPW